jgi:RNA polymerase sigma factor (sigma-70 family)
MRVGRRERSAAEESFDDAFQNLFTHAYRVARRILGDSAAAEDIAAETLSRAYAHWDRIWELPYREAWIVRVATNLTLNACRRRPRAFRSHDLSHHDDATATRLALAAALQALPVRQREVIVLRHLAGLSEPEVAERLGVSLGTVKTHLRRAKVALRGRLSADILGAGSDAT